MAEKNKKNKEKTKTRPPIVVVLGHVDHGKSSLLEAVKDLKITEKEAEWLVVLMDLPQIILSPSQ